MSQVLIYVEGEKILGIHHNPEILTQEQQQKGILYTGDIPEGFIIWDGTRPVASERPTPEPQPSNPLLLELERLKQDMATQKGAIDFIIMNF